MAVIIMMDKPDEDWPAPDPYDDDDDNYDDDDDDNEPYGDDFDEAIHGENED